MATGRQTRAQSAALPGEVHPLHQTTEVCVWVCGCACACVCACVCVCVCVCEGGTGSNPVWGSSVL